MSREFKLYRGLEFVKQGSSPLQLSSLEVGTIYPEGYFKLSAYDTVYKNESTKVDVPEFTTMYTNHLPQVTANNFSLGDGATVTDDNNEIVFTLDGKTQLRMYGTRSQSPLTNGKQYTISCEIMLEDGFTGDPSGICLQHSYSPGGKVVLQTTTVPKNTLNKWQKLIGTQTVTYTSDTPNEWYASFIDTKSLKPSGKVRLRHIKIEEGLTATPYQPNLLDAPYWLGKVPLGENIASKAVRFPIKSTEFNLYIGDTKEDLMVGQTYTLTLKGTKPATQTFTAFNRWDIRFGDLKPVEGLVDVWSLTFTPTDVVQDFPKNFRIYQRPEATAGPCQIDWIKLEKGDTRTPNIDYYKYVGTLTDDTETPTLDPTKYTWTLNDRGFTNTMHRLYSNSIDFGPYDYSGKPNVSAKLNISSFSSGTGATVTGDVDSEVIFKLDGSNQLIKYNTAVKLPKLTDGNTYTISADIKFHSDIVGDVRNLSLCYSYLPDVKPALQTITPILDITTGKWIKIKGTNTIKYGSNQPDSWYLVFRDMMTANRISGTISLKNFQVVEGTQPLPKLVN